MGFLVTAASGFNKLLMLLTVLGNKWGQITTKTTLGILVGSDKNL